MPLAAGADALVFRISAAEVRSLNAVGTVNGVAITFVSGAIGPGVGLLSYLKDAEGLSFLQFRAPGSSMFGEFVALTADGSYLVSDGEERGKYIRVTVDISKLPAANTTAAIYLADVFDQDVAGAPATAGQAAAGQTLDYEIELYNQSNRALEHVTAWMLPQYVAGFAIGSDGISYSSPVTQATGIALANIAAGASGTLYIRRTLAAGAKADPDLLAVFKVAFVGGP